MLLLLEKGSIVVITIKKKASELLLLLEKGSIVVITIKKKASELLLLLEKGIIVVITIKKRQEVLNGAKNTYIYKNYILLPIT